MSAPTIYALAYTGGPMRLDGATVPVVFDLAGMRKPSHLVPILRGHNHLKIVGHAERVRIGPATVEAWGVVSACGLPDGREVVTTARNGFKWKASISAESLTADRYREGETVRVNGAPVRGPVFVVRESVLKEISVVPLAADDDTKVVIGADVAPARASRTASRPVPAPAPKPKPSGSIVGMAVVFGEWMQPTMTGFPAGTRVRFAPGAFDRFLSRVERGKGSVPLWFDHLEGTDTASTTDGSLKVLALGAGLLFSVSDKTPKGRAAISIARGLPDTRSVSVGASLKQYTKAERDFDTYLDVTEAELDEISLVRAGACPGVWVQVE